MGVIVASVFTAVGFENLAATPAAGASPNSLSSDRRSIPVLHLARKPFLKSLAVNPHHPAVAPEHMYGRSFAFVYQAPEGFAVDARYRGGFLDFEH